MMHEEAARSGGPAINGAIKVSRLGDHGVHVKIGYRQFPSLEVIRDLNGVSTMAWYHEEVGGSENLLGPSEDHEFDA